MRILKNMNEFFLSIGRARAAAELHRMGYLEEAKQLMLQNK